MKSSLKRLFLTSIIVVLSLLVLSCKVILRDHQSPCTSGVYYDSLVCEQWKQKFPGEYRNYQKRMMKNN